jgi:hypothetical protein
MKIIDKTWIYEKTELNVLQWNYVIATQHPEAKSWIRSPDDYKKKDENNG